jgi:hypothetical protein
VAPPPLSRRGRSLRRPGLAPRTVHVPGRNGCGPSSKRPPGREVHRPLRAPPTHHARGSCHPLPCRHRRDRLLAQSRLPARRGNVTWVRKRTRLGARVSSSRRSRQRPEGSRQRERPWGPQIPPRKRVRMTGDQRGPTNHQGPTNFAGGVYHPPRPRSAPPQIGPDVRNLQITAGTMQRLKFFFPDADSRGRWVTLVSGLDRPWAAPLAEGARAAGCVVVITDSPHRVSAAGFRNRRCAAFPACGWIERRAPRATRAAGAARGASAPRG